ncbi:MAG: PBSX family phage terminase large subunit [Ruminococcus sp.]|nr:PBSX family phage terminase large subunit [Ruminococcus sp.]
MVKLTIKPFSEKQLRVLSWWSRSSDYHNCDAIICDGAVRSGKTFCMVLSFIIWSFYSFGNSDFALCGKTIRSLRRNMVTPVIPILKSLGFSCDEKITQNILNVSYMGVKNRFYLFGGKDESSASLIQGMTLSGVLFDEVALMPRSFVEQAMARCSVNGSRFWFNCNPEYPEHWFNVEWIKKSKEKNALYLHFTMDDNPSLSEKVKQRYENLYSGVFYERFVKGRWIAVYGAVYPFMDDESMYCDVPEGGFSKFAISCDYGTVNPASFGLWGRQGDVWYRIDEYYFNSRKEGWQKTDEEHYKALCDLAGERKISQVVVDPSAASFIEVIKRHGKFKVTPAQNNVVNGIRRVSQVLRDGSVKICRNCSATKREFSLYRWDSRKTDDVPVKENDHAMDDLRYFVTTVIDGGTKMFAFAAQRQEE